MKKSILILVLIGMTMTLAACAAGPNRQMKMAR